MVAIGAGAYGLLYGHASALFKLLVPVALIVLVGLVVRDVIKDRAGNDE